jgi:hypothetical protein
LRASCTSVSVGGRPCLNSFRAVTTWASKDSRTAATLQQSLID